MPNFLFSISTKGEKWNSETHISIFSKGKVKYRNKDSIFLSF